MASGRGGPNAVRRLARPADPGVNAMAGAAERDLLSDDGATGTPPRALLVANRHSRAAAGKLPDAVARLEAAGIVIVHVEPASRAEVADVIHRKADRVDAVVVGGGDGTLNAAVPAIVETRLPRSSSAAVTAR